MLEISGSEKVLLSVHSQQGYGRGTGSEEIINKVEDYEGHAILLKDSEAGEVYGGEELFDLVIEEDEIYGVLKDEISDVIPKVYDEIEIIGMYGSECVANTAESVGPENVKLDPEAIVDQIFGQGNFVLSELLETGDEKVINQYVERFRNREVASKILYKGGFLEDRESEPIEQYTDPENRELKSAREGEDAVILS